MRRILILNRNFAAMARCAAFFLFFLTINIYSTIQEVSRYRYTLYKLQLISETKRIKIWVPVSYYHSRSYVDDFEV